MGAAGDFIALQALRRPDKLAAVDLASGARWTYAELDDLTARLAAGLAVRGLNLGDRLAVLAKNRAELIALQHACARLGAAYVPLNWRLSPAELAALVEDCDPALLLGDDQLDSAGLSGEALEAFLVEARGLAPHAHSKTDPERISLILYTSGTSGMPKGAMLSEANLTETAINFSILGEVTDRSVFLCDAPMFHIIGLVTNVRPTLMRGGTCLVSDAFVPDRTLDRMADPELGVTHYFCVPQMAAALREQSNFDPAHLQGLTGVFTGGAPHPAPNINAWLDDGICIVDGFGMSETGTVFGMPVDRELIRKRAGSAGQGTPRLQSRIVDANGQDCPIGEAGELWLRGPGVFKGYWRRPEANEGAFSDGWFKTGDIAISDAEGYHWLVDRKKDMFISGGENVYPAEIEAALCGHPDVAECAIVGVADERWGEVGHAFIVTRSGHDATAEAFMGWLDGRLARYKLPRHVSFIDALPRNGAGKVLKRELRDYPLPEMARQR
ncbi:AMP-binding protein [Maricaulis parjimensis]|uniref:AMP-binding protein n=1 Tax=Maricaulis parjimensis TaxID=144023 RepID=UPI001939C36B|nr:AMP-binding protein [Maricaulis parjimensis]